MERKIFIARINLQLLPDCFKCNYLSTNQYLWTTFAYSLNSIYKKYSQSFNGVGLQSLIHTYADDW